MERKMLFLVCLVSLLAVTGIASAGDVVHNFVGQNTCQSDGDIYIDFEDGSDLTEITNQYPGLTFTGVTEGSSWKYGDVSTNHDWIYPAYYCNGNFWVSLEGASGESNAGGLIGFDTPPAYVSLLVSGHSPVWLEAYDSQGTLIDTAGPTIDNLETSTMDKLTVSGNDIVYVIVHDTGQYWVIDDLCVGTTTNPVPAPEFPTLFMPAAFIIGFLGVILLIRIRNE